MNPETIVELLRARAENSPRRLAFRHLSRGTEGVETLDYGQLHERACAIAVTLTQAGLEGERALLLYPPGLEYISAYFGCLYAGVTAVPCYPPGLTRASAAAVPRIAKDCGARAVLTLSAWAKDVTGGKWLEGTPQSLSYFITDAADLALAPEWEFPAIDESSIAFLQYTSGSTGDPKGVMVTHGNLMANLRMIRGAFGAGPDDRACFWLPPYHDMGLIGGILGAIYCDTPTTIMPPATFMRSPLSWLRAISDARATITGAPNFAFDRCVRAALAKPELMAGIDLSSLELTFSGAEMVRADTMDEFCRVFAKNGFRRESVMPCYGMAETTLLCSARPRMSGFESHRIDRRRLEQEGRAVDASEGETERSWMLVGCGAVAGDTEVRIVRESTQEPCEPGEVGEIWVNGPSVAQGYWGKSELSAAVFGATLKGSDDGAPRFLRTGDRGFFRKDELFIAGRTKDVVIAAGRNYAAEDLESSVRTAHRAVKPYRCVAFSVDEANTERLVVLLECDNKILAEDEQTIETLLDAVHRRVLQDHGLDANDVLAVKAGDLPVTTSGKLKRGECRARYAGGSLQVIARRGVEVIAVDAPKVVSDGAYLAAVQAAVRRHSPAPTAEGTRLCDLGLDSLKACELSVDLGDQFGVELGPSLLVAETTLGQVAAHLQAHAGGKANGHASGKTNGAAPSNVHAADAPAKGPAVASKPLTDRLRCHAEQFGRLKAAGVMNYNLVQERKLGATDANIGGETLTFFSSYSYLALNSNPEVVDAKINAVKRFGSGAHGVSLLGGYTSEHEALERQLAKIFCTDEAVLYSSGYMANLAAIDALMKEDGTIYCDMLVHTSILDGCRLSGAEVRMFPHQDAEALGRMLARRPKGRPALVIVDGVYSLRGEIANLPAIVEAAHEHGALVMVDEAHALGGVGLHGRGTAEHHGVEGKVDIVTGGLGKGIPAYGGYVAARSDIIHYLRFRSNPHVFSGAMDSSNVAAARAALNILERDPKVMQRLRDNITLMERLLEAHRIPSLRWGSPCMPVVCKDDMEAYALSREMRRRGFYIAPIVYPAVPKDQQGLRLTVTSGHTATQIRRCVEELDDALRVLRTNPKKPLLPPARKNGTTMIHHTSVERTYTPIPEALAAFARGELLLVSDDEDRENEGDLVMAAEHATPAAINFMITHGKGLVCLAVSREIATQKQLHPMVMRNRDPKGTAFTVSVDGSQEHGITTGISASERARTVQVIIDGELGPDDLRAPGHMFPLVAKPGGIKERRGHTEAGVDLARLSGCDKAAAVIVEVIKEDGEMARRDELIAMSKKFKIPYITIDQLAEYMAAQEDERREADWAAIAEQPTSQVA